METKSEPPSPRIEVRGRPTALEFMSSFHAEAAKVTGADLAINPELSLTPLPKWGVKTLERLRKTVMRPVLKLKPTLNSNCQDYGKILGILERQIAFLQVDIWEILQAEGLDKITDDEWEKIQPAAQTRAHIIWLLKRPVSDEEKTNDLANEVYVRKIENLEEMRKNGFAFMAHRGAKDRAKFLKGLGQGYNAFMDVSGKLCGDRGRTEIYSKLLSSQFEIEKMRRMLPPRNDDDLYDHLAPWFKFPFSDRDQSKAWLRDVCDDISLCMTGKRGPRAGISKLKTAPDT